MRNYAIGLSLAGILLAGTSQTTAHELLPDGLIDAEQWRFQRVSTFGNYLNRVDIGEETVSEIVAVTEDGKTLVYTDGERASIGFVDITVPANPVAAGMVEGLGGEPTSVDVLGNRLALVAVNTSNDFVNPSGQLVAVNIATKTLVGSPIQLGGQPDSIKISPDGQYVAIAIENERDEDVNDGELPQLPAGNLIIIDILGSDSTDGWGLRTVDLSGLADYGASDPEPEFVDINEENQAVVSLQENNHVVLVDLAEGEVIGHFPAGTVNLEDIDATEDDVIRLEETLTYVPREPDAIAWVPVGNSGQYLIATANEGDLFGGSRGFSLFDRFGRVRYDSGNTLEHIAVRHGHYPEGRSENKGNEPEAIELGRYASGDYLFVGSERGSFIAVYRLFGGQPRFVQLLPAPLGPEGLLAVPSRNLLIASGEEDDPSYGVRSTIMLYELKQEQATYPQIASAAIGGLPIPWSALSGMVAVPGEPNKLLAVWDSFFSESQILTIDVSTKPARIVDTLTINDAGVGSGDYDPEGIAIDHDGYFWIASEGNMSDSRPNRLLKVDPATGDVLIEIGLPQRILDCRADTRAFNDEEEEEDLWATFGSGFEGVTIVPKGDGFKLLVAQQRGWNYRTGNPADGCEDLDDDAGGLNAKGQPNRTRIWVYDPDAETWDHISWELADLPENASWVGLSEITRSPDGDYVLIERDNLTGDFAALKTLAKVQPIAVLDRLIDDNEKAKYDLIPDLEATNGWITDKPEGLAITDSGQIFLVTDNDGVDDWSGETWFLDLGRVWGLFW